MKLDLDGGAIWARHWGNAGTYSSSGVDSIAVTPDGRTWIGGAVFYQVTFGSQTLGAPPPDNPEGPDLSFFLASLTSDGEVITATALTSTQPQNLAQGPLVALAPSGDLVV